MIGFLASRFIKDYQNTSDAAVRRAYGVLCGAVGHQDETIEVKAALNMLTN